MLISIIPSLQHAVLCGRWEEYPREFAKCRRCRKAKYCGKECQSSAWSEGHRFWCSAREGGDETGEGASTVTGAQPQSGEDGEHTASGSGGRRQGRERQRVASTSMVANSANASLLPGPSTTERTTGSSTRSAMLPPVSFVLSFYHFMILILYETNSYQQMR